MRYLLSLLLLLAPEIASANGAAQSYPERPIELIVPFSDGSHADRFARALAQRLSAALGQSVSVRNVTGLSGSRGLSRVARAAPNGYTLGLVSDAMLTANLLIYQYLPYDPLNDFIPVGRLTATPSVIVVPSASPFTTLQDVIDDARARPAQQTFAHLGTGSAGHVVGHLLMTRARIDLKAVEIASVADHRKAIEENEVGFGVLAVQDALPLVDKGVLRPLAVTSPERSPMFPDVPTLAERGFPRCDASPWIGLVAPRRTPREIIERINVEAMKALRQSEFVADLTADGTQVVAGSPGEMTGWVRSRLAELWPLLSDLVEYE